MTIHDGDSLVNVFVNRDSNAIKCGVCSWDDGSIEQLSLLSGSTYVIKLFIKLPLLSVLLNEAILGIKFNADCVRANELRLK